MNDDPEIKLEEEPDEINPAFEMGKAAIEKYKLGTILNVISTIAFILTVAYFSFYAGAMQICENQNAVLQTDTMTCKPMYVIKQEMLDSGFETVTVGFDK